MNTHTLHIHAPHPRTFVIPSVRALVALLLLLQPFCRDSGREAKCARVCVVLMANGDMQYNSRGLQVVLEHTVLPVVVWGEANKTTVMHRPDAVWFTPTYV